MAKQIIWSPLASTDFESVLDYLNENWSEQAKWIIFNEQNAHANGVGF